jgi:hypothetical protein
MKLLHIIETHFSLNLGFGQCISRLQMCNGSRNNTSMRAETSDWSGPESLFAGKLCEYAT